MPRVRRERRMRHIVAAHVLASALLATSLATGCRTASVNGKTDPDPTVKSAIATAETTEIAALPESPAKVLVAQRCLLCHGAALITQQHKDTAAWGRTVTQMRTWGSPIQDDDQTALVTYLTEHFGPSAARR